MHLLAARPGVIADGGEAVDLGQDPAEIVILSAADTELACLARALERFGPGFPGVRLANLMRLGHNLSVDLYVERVIAGARLVHIRLIGGLGYWPYGVERIAECCRAGGIALSVAPGDDQPDPELARLSTLAPGDLHRLWQYGVHGGIENAAGLLGFAASLIGWPTDWREPRPLPPAGLYWPGLDRPSLAGIRSRHRSGAPMVPVIFYRALAQAGNLAPVDALIAALDRRGLAPLPVHVSSLKEAASARLVEELMAACRPAAILNATGFALSSPGAARSRTPFDAADCPVLQIVFSGQTRQGWEGDGRGLSARDIAMNVALPEVDGRVLSRAVSFKAEARFDARTQCSIVTYAPVPDRVDFVADLAAGWARLRAAPAAGRRVALILANYPNRDGRIGNGVGLDTPAAASVIVRALADAGYDTGDAPAGGAALMALLTAGPTNAPRSGGAQGGVRHAIAGYRDWFARLPAVARAAIRERWGEPEEDPFADGDAFRLPVHCFGNLAIAIQPARGYNIDPAETHHDPALVPPHGYLALYAWLREAWGAHAVVHLGKHGNLEWLPGKALALSSECWPEAALGPLPHLYPFIVNDPGEGAQAKRRSAAVIIDHLTPPLTRAGAHGPLKALEALVDEYYEAAGLDPRRLRPLARQIVELAQSIGLDRDCGITASDDEAGRLAKLDAFLCELKELQIRDGLHVFGEPPSGIRLRDLLAALVRVPRGRGEGADASLPRALAADLGLDGFDPLDLDLARAWTGKRPAVLARLLPETVWRTAGDTVERIERLIELLIAGERQPAAGWHRTRAVLDGMARSIRPALLASGQAEIDGLLRGLDGRFVPPGPSGAPSRGRPEVLPTGRNFYSVDTRAVPTATAWQLGWKSAARLLDRYRQDHGAWPARLALSAWGTANMRTGGDDIAQMLALLGVQPRWEAASGRVTGFEIIPLSVLDRPRVDVTLRISGFFRDAFPGQIDLIDSAARAVAALDEPAAMNPLAARVRADAAALEKAGEAPAEARRRAGHRIFGARPGAYGAGLQALIDERLWREEADLARAYVAWGGHAYGAGIAGAAEPALFAARLSAVELVLHNQDNREHDLLDSDDYYQFEGGLAAAVHHHSGARPVVYHLDHSRPEAPRVRTLGEEIARVVRGRAVNPKWIAGVMRHGYKGAFEMAATVDYLFAFAATTGQVADHHFDAVYAAYLEDPAVRDFIAGHNPAALREIAERLLEAQQRGLWRPRANTAHNRLAELAAGRGAGHG